MGEPPTPHFYDFGTFGRVPEPQNQLFVSLESPGYLKNQENPWNILKNMIVVNLKMSETHFLSILEKGGRRKMMKIRLIDFENLIYETNIFRISVKETEGSFESLKPRNQETKKLRTKKPRN